MYVDTRLGRIAPNTTNNILSLQALSLGSPLKYLKAQAGIKACRLITGGCVYAKGQKDKVENKTPRTVKIAQPPNQTPPTALRGVRKTGPQMKKSNSKEGRKPLQRTKHKTRINMPIIAAPMICLGHFASSNSLIFLTYIPFMH